MKTGEDCGEEVEQVCTGVMVHRPLGCAEADFSTCLQLIRQDEISCASLALIEVAPLAAEAGAGLEEARKLAMELEKVDPCLESKVVGRCRAIMPRFYFDR